VSGNSHRDSRNLNSRVTRRVLVSGIATSLLTRPARARAQAVSGTPRVAVFIYPRRPEGFPQLHPFSAGLQEAGWIVGRNVMVTVYYAENVDDLPRAAARVVDTKPDVILANTTSAAAAMKRVTQTIPIVMAAAGDPVAAGLVGSLARPGANVTGLTLVVPETAAIRLQFLHEAAPAASHVAACHPGLADLPVIREWIRESETAAKVLGLRLTVTNIGSDPRAWEPSLRALVRDGVRGMSVVDSPVINTNRKTIAGVALHHRLSSIFGSREVPDAGGLMSYGPNAAAMFRRAAAFVDKILRGATPAELPIESPREFELVINSTTARTLGLTIPPSLLVRATHVIE
jgi:putative tryptophan/tyrosine transport system substrate-binding protein